MTHILLYLFGRSAMWGAITGPPRHPGGSLLNWYRMPSQLSVVHSLDCGAMGIAENISHMPTLQNTLSSWLLFC